MKLGTKHGSTHRAEEYYGVMEPGHGPKKQTYLTSKTTNLNLAIKKAKAKLTAKPESCVLCWSLVEIPIQQH